MIGWGSGFICWVIRGVMARLKFLYIYPRIILDKLSESNDFWKIIYIITDKNNQT